MMQPARRSGRSIDASWSASRTGTFAFRTYGDRDGVPAGNYVLTFTQLVDRGKRGYFGPDGLKNLYNDPDKSEFSIAHAKGGRSDYVFDLKIERARRRRCRTSGRAKPGGITESLHHRSSTGAMTGPRVRRARGPQTAANAQIASGRRSSYKPRLDLVDLTSQAF